MFATLLPECHWDGCPSARSSQKLSDYPVLGYLSDHDQLFACVAGNTQKLYEKLCNLSLIYDSRQVNPTGPDLGFACSVKCKTLHSDVSAFLNQLSLPQKKTPKPVPDTWQWAGQMGCRVPKWVSCLIWLTNLEKERKRVLVINGLLKGNFSVIQWQFHQLKIISTISKKRFRPFVAATVCNAMDKKDKTQGCVDVRVVWSSSLIEDKVKSFKSPYQ